MSSEIVEKYKKQLLDSIPATESLHIDIEKILDNSLTLSAPLSPNINYEGTVFGGSLNTLGILSCYLLVHHLMKLHSIPFSSLVIQNSEISYIKPVHGDFTATSTLPDQREVQLFLKSISKKGRGRLQINSLIRTRDSDEVLVNFSGRFVASL